MVDKTNKRAYNKTMVKRRTRIFMEGSGADIVLSATKEDLKMLYQWLDDIPEHIIEAPAWVQVLCEELEFRFDDLPY